MLEWIDLHAHLDKIKTDVDETLKQAKDNGVVKVVTIGTEPADHQVVFDLGKKYFPDVFCTLGVHPHEGGLYSEAVGGWISNHLSEPWVIAVGEIGLDYFYTHSNREDQRKSFYEQLEIAAQHKLPVEIHTRDAEQDTVDILNQFKGRVNGIIHCFTGTQWLAEKCLDLGFNISISGIATFKNAEALRDVVRYLPLDRMHVETDAPFLAPVPQRGKENTPAFMIHTAQFVAELKNQKIEEFSLQMKQNALKMFPKIKW